MSHSLCLLMSNTDNPLSSLHSSALAVRCKCLAKMLSTFLLWLSISFCFSNAENFEIAENAESGLEDLVERLELRLKVVEERMLVEKVKVAELENEVSTMKEESKKRERRLEATISDLRKRVEDESVTKESVTNLTANGSPNSSVRGLPIVFISAWQPNDLLDVQTVPFESFLANFNNVDTPGGGDGLFDLDSGTFTCLTPGYYTVSFSAHVFLYSEYQRNERNTLYLYKNGVQLPESYWHFESTSGALNNDLVVTGTRILVRKLHKTMTTDNHFCRSFTWIMETL